MNIVADSVDVDHIQTIFDSQKANQFRVGASTAKDRKGKLLKLKQAVEVTFRQEIRDALYKDFGKPKAEVDMVEVYPVVSEIKHAISNLSEWMSNQYVKTPLSLLGSSSYIKYEPKGVCLIISPWNYPINLCFGPLASAIAAGNTVIIKPSEYTVHTSALMKKLIASIFSDNEICVIEGGVETSTKLLELPFNHIFFTGSPQVGKVVMQAAAKTLSSVTLELGGKSPTIVDETADIKLAAKRIIHGKMTNAGQTCIAPDYVLVQASRKLDLLNSLKKTLNDFYGENPAESKYFANLVNERHAGRMVKYLEDAALKGATVHGGKMDPNRNFVQPTLVTDVPMDCELMREEIFGPILPILSYQSLDEAVKLINSKEKPLGLYIYSRSDKNIEYILNNTRAGNSCVNHNAINYFNVNLPFGGSNNSGIGKAHGFYGFEAFSNQRAVYRQHIPGAIDLLVPPFTSWKQKLIELTVKYF